MSPSMSIPDDISQARLTTYQAGVLQAAANRNLKRIVGRFLKPFNITVMEWFALGVIRDCGAKGIRISDLAATLRTTIPYTTKLLNELENREWVTKDDDAIDNRVKTIRLTEGTEDICQTIEDDLRHKMRSYIYDRVPPQDLTGYLHVLYVISRL
jgi:DNA-binding MarR family transcriptional regulator